MSFPVRMLRDWEVWHDQDGNAKTGYPRGLVISVDEVLAGAMIGDGAAEPMRELTEGVQASIDYHAKYMELSRAGYDDEAIAQLLAAQPPEEELQALIAEREQIDARIGELRAQLGLAEAPAPAESPQPEEAAEAGPATVLEEPSVVELKTRRPAKKKG